MMFSIVMHDMRWSHTIGRQMQEMTMEKKTKEPICKPLYAFDTLMNCSCEGSPGFGSLHTMAMAH